VPEQPIVPFIEGDGIGPDIWRAAKAVIDAAVKKAYSGERSIAWLEILAGEKALEQTGEWLPSATVDAVRYYRVAIKGPLTTPVGGGIRSLNVALRQLLDLYACVRPVRYFDGVPSPVREPEKVDMVLFRENTEDVYAGHEWQEGTAETAALIDFIRSELGRNIRDDSGVGIKPVSVTGSKRLVRKAIDYARAQGRESVTLVHKGNIMKFTEGAFKEFEATHGTAPKYAGQDKVNPCSVILSGVMMLNWLGWQEAGRSIENAISRAIRQKRVTYDLERQMEGATLLKTSEFGQAIVENLD